MDAEENKKRPNELIQAVLDFQQGKEDAFARIYNKTKKYVYYTIYKSVQDAALAEDIMQETYLEVYRSLSTLKNETAIKGWIGKIAHHRICHYLGESPEPLLDDSEEGDIFTGLEQTDESLMPEEVVENREIRRLIGEIINGLSEPQRQTIIAFYYNQMSIREISEACGIPENTVKSHLARGKDKIREGVLRLEKEQGTKLYEIGIPALLFFIFGEEAQACEVSPQLSDKILRTTADHPAPEPSRTALQGRESGKQDTEAGKIPGAAGAHSAGAAAASKAGLGLGVKLCLAVAGIAAAGGILWGAAYSLRQVQNDRRAETEQTSDRETQQATDRETEMAAQTVSPREETAKSETVETATESEAIAEDPGFQYLVEMKALEETPKESFLNVRGGVMPIRRDGLWGAVNYDGELIVPCKYTRGAMAPNEFGQFILGDGELQYAFDREGNIIAQADRITSVYGDYVTFKERTGKYDEEWGAEIYRGTVGKLDGTVLAQMETGDWDFGVVGFGDSDVTYMGTADHLIRVKKDGSTEEFFPIYSEGVDEEGSLWTGSGASTSFYYVPGGAYLDGYYMDSWGITEEFCLMKDQNVFRGISPWRVARELWGDEKGDVDSMSADRLSILHHGSWSYNYGTKAGIRFYNSETGETVGFMLVDLGLIPSITGGMEAESFVGFYDSLTLNTEKYWLISTEGKWGYIDHDGTVMNLYDDASAFEGGYAVVIENGTAYLIDEDFEKLEELGSVQSCQTYGEVFCLETEEGIKFYRVKDGQE